MKVSDMTTEDLERLADECRDMGDAAHQQPGASKYMRTLWKAEKALRDVLPRREAEGWRGVSTAPFDTPVAVKVGGMIFEAILQPDVSIDEDNEFCSQWQAVNEGEHPPCWSDGACWGSNADGMISLQPTHWRPLPSTPTTEASHGE